MNNKIQKYQWGKAIKWIGTALDDAYRLIHKPIVTRKYAKMGVDVTSPQNKRIIAALSGFNSRHVPDLFPEWHLHNSLLNQGVAPELLTTPNLQKLIGKRIDALELGLNFPSRYSVKFDLGFDAPVYEYHLYRSAPLGGRKVGGIHISTRSNGDNTVNMIGNSSSGRNRVTGVSEQGYNAVVQDLGNVVSGESLMAPHITTKVWDKFPNKTFLGNYGRHHYPNSKVSFELGPVWRLETPTYQAPMKIGNNFDVMSITPKGKFTVDFNKGPMFKKGGKIPSI